ncbi:hypothetical protein FRC08_008831 [Ceratobasidium sp. 394]|nr:hypothetical protein FRC08_008831 [Ceratobasidium sp. 394]KAG9091783.1 hypothetical protein FS749_016246 [Ceratobasidium sp. UAMH 11750]
MTLPTDIIYLIAQYLTCDRKVLSHPARLTSDLYRALRSLFFENVLARTSASPVFFCDTICSSPRNPPFYLDGNPWSDQLRGTLLRMPWLRNDSVSPVNSL